MSGYKVKLNIDKYNKHIASLKPHALFRVHHYTFVSLTKPHMFLKVFKVHPTKVSRNNITTEMRNIKSANCKFMLLVKIGLCCYNGQKLGEQRGIILKYYLKVNLLSVFVCIV